MGSAVQDARNALFAGPRAHLFDYVTDRTSREAILLRTYTDDLGAAIRQAKAEAAPAIVLPAGDIPVMTPVPLDDFALIGETPTACSRWPYKVGSRVLAGDDDVTLFPLRKNAGCFDLVFFDPLQLENPAGPRVRKPLFANHASGDMNVTGWMMDRCVIPNAYIVARVGGQGAFEKGGMNSITRCRITPIYHGFELNHQPDWWDFSMTEIGTNYFAGELYDHYGGGDPAGEWLATFIANNASAFYIWGDGTDETISTYSVDCIKAGRMLVYGLAAVIEFNGGTLGNLNLTGLMVDGCKQFIKAGRDSAIHASKVTLGGGCFAYNASDLTDATPPFIDIDNPRACDIVIEGDLGFCTGPVSRVRGEGVSRARVDVSCPAFAHSNTPGEYVGIDFDCPNGVVSSSGYLKAVIDSPEIMQTGVRVTAAKASKISVVAENCDVPFDIVPEGPAHIVDGCIAIDTYGFRSLIAAPGVTLGANVFDKPDLDTIASSPVVASGKTYASAAPA